MIDMTNLSSKTEKFTITVFCSASNKLDDHYYKMASDLGHLLAKENVKIVYGGASIGMMGSLAKAALDSNGEVIGVIPEVILAREFALEGVTELIKVPDMHSRKKIMYELCDLVLVLPGGFGTLDEACEFMTWNQLGIHKKPLTFLNYNGFYDHFQEFCTKLKKEKFIKNYDEYEPQFITKTQDILKWCRNDK